jgi:Fe2+ transport system protein FeoA
MKCTFCGHVFDATAANSACGHCLLNKSCDLVRCPHCGSEMVGEGPQKVQAVEEVSLPLTELEPDREAVVTHLATRDRLVLRKMIAMGVLPGAKIILLQRSPSFVFGIGHDRFTVDRELASLVHVKKEGPR